MAEQANPGAEGIKLFGFEIKRASKKEDDKKLPSILSLIHI